MYPPFACTVSDISLPVRRDVPLNSMCSRKCDNPAPRFAASWMLPVLTHTWTDTRWADRSGFTSRVSPFGRTVRSTGSRHKAFSRTRSACGVLEMGISMLPSGGTERLGCGGTPGALRRQERLHKHVVEIVQVCKVLPSVAFGFAEGVIFYKVKYDIPKILALADPPGIQDDFSDLFTIHDVPVTNVLLHLGGAGTIRVSVTDHEGHALSRYEGHELLVDVEPKGGSKVGSWGGSATVKADGTFEFSNVPPGEYRITSRPNPSTSNRQYASEQVVTVAPGDQTNVNVIYE